MLYSWPFPFTLFLPIPFFVPPCSTPLHIPSLICMVLPFPSQILKLLFFLPSYQLQSPGVHSQSQAWSFLMAHQLQTGDFGSLALSPLSLVCQVSACLFLFMASPFTYYLLLHWKGLWDKCNEEYTVAFHVPLHKLSIKSCVCKPTDQLHPK